MGAKQLFRRDLRLPAIHPKKYFKIILDNKILNCYYQINTDSIPWRSVPSHRQPSECRPRDTQLGAFIFLIRQKNSWVCSDEAELTHKLLRRGKNNSTIAGHVSTFHLPWQSSRRG